MTTETGERQARTWEQYLADTNELGLPMAEVMRLDERINYLEGICGEIEEASGGLIGLDLPPVVAFITHPPEDAPAEHLKLWPDIHLPENWKISVEADPLQAIPEVMRDLAARLTAAAAEIEKLAD